jgi:DNA-directed RNA polymerase subunit omega
MARITIEDCIEQVPNRFHLVQMCAIRAKQLKKGATPLVQSEGNKEVVMALREIAAGKISPDLRDPAILEAERRALIQAMPAPQPVAVVAPIRPVLVDLDEDDEDEDDDDADDDDDLDEDDE